MSTQEKMLEKLRLDLLKNVEAYFDSIDRFDSEFILNSSVSKDSPFEKNQFCSDFTVYNLNELPIIDIMLGDTSEISVFANIRVATSSTFPKRGKELNSWRIYKHHCICLVVKDSPRWNYFRSNKNVKCELTTSYFSLTAENRQSFNIS